VVFPSTVPFYQLNGRPDLSLPGSWCEYDYANGGQGDPNTYGTEIARVYVGFGPVTVAQWNNFEAWQRKNAYAGLVGNTGALGTAGTLGYQALNLGGGSRAFQMSLSNYWENSQSQASVTGTEVFALTRHGNVIWVDLSPVLVSTSGETDSSPTMAQDLVRGALSEGSF
jgi:hypothetical protein